VIAQFVRHPAMSHFVEHNGENKRQGHDRDLLYGIEFFHECFIVDAVSRGEQRAPLRKLILRENAWYCQEKTRDAAIFRS
jgi:hypothetical protein